MLPAEGAEITGDRFSCFAHRKQVISIALMKRNTDTAQIHAFHENWWCRDVDSAGRKRPVCSKSGAGADPGSSRTDRRLASCSVALSLNCYIMIASTSQFSPDMLLDPASPHLT